MDYRVSFEIDVVATTPEGAAQEALNMLRDDDWAFPKVFVVKWGEQPGQATVVELE